MDEFIVKDSGQRQEYASGMVRDVLARQILFTGIEAVSNNVNILGAGDPGNQAKAGREAREAATLELFHPRARLAFRLHGAAGGFTEEDLAIGQLLQGGQTRVHGLLAARGEMFSTDRFVREVREIVDTFEV